LQNIYRENITNREDRNWGTTMVPLDPAMVPLTVADAATPEVALGDHDDEVWASR
jgi:hypothetical protein